MEKQVKYIISLYEVRKIRDLKTWCSKAEGCFIRTIMLTTKISGSRKSKSARSRAQQKRKDENFLPIGFAKAAEILSLAIQNFLPVSRWCNWRNPI